MFIKGKTREFDTWGLLPLEAGHIKIPADTPIEILGIDDGFATIQFDGHGSNVVIHAGAIAGLQEEKPEVKSSMAGTTISPHFIIGEGELELIQKFFDTCEDPTCTNCPAPPSLPEDTTIEELMVEAGVFPSKGQARKNGHAGEIPFGLSKLGTKKKPVWVWRF
jgi:hypothetical protein